MDENGYSQTMGNTREGPTEEQIALQAEVDRNKRQIEEARKQNVHLMERLTDAEKRHSTLAVKSDEFRRKVDQAVVLMNKQKEESDSLRKKLNQMESEKIRLARKVRELENSNEMSTMADFETQISSDPKVTPAPEVAPAPASKVTKVETKPKKPGNTSKPPASDAA